MAKLIKSGSNIIFEDGNVKWNEEWSEYGFRLVSTTNVGVYLESHTPVLKLFDGVYANLLDETDTPFTEATLNSFLASFSSSGGGGGGDASADHQLTQISEATDTNTKLDTVITALGLISTESKLEEVRVLLNSLDGKDYSTQTTLAGLLSAFLSEDFATDAKLEEVRALLDAELDVNVTNNDLNVKAEVYQANNFELDSAGRKRTSSPLALGGYSHVNGLNSDLVNFEGTGTATYQDLTDGVVGIKMEVTAGQYMIGETKYPHPYIKGFSQNFTNTTQNFQLESGLIKRMGYFSSATTGDYSSEFDGMYLESNGDDNEFYLCLTRKGTIVLKKPRGEWDDKLDGTGASGLTIDWSVFNILNCDFLWLGGKGGRFNMAIGNTIVCLYNYAHAGNTQGLIMRNPNQPLRFEIRSTTGVGYMYWICGDVVSEGTERSLTIPRMIETPDKIDASATGTNYLTIAFRLKSNRRNAVVSFDNYDIIGLTNDSFTAKIVVNPTIAGDPLVWVDYSPTSAVEYAIGDTSNPSTNIVTGGTALLGGGASNRISTLSTQTSGRINSLSRNIDGTSDIFALVVNPKNSGLDVYAVLNLLEDVI